MNLFKLINAYRTAFWRWRDDIGFGDDFFTENSNLEKRLRNFINALRYNDQLEIAAVTSFLDKNGVLTPEVMVLLAPFTKVESENIFVNKNDNQKVLSVVYDINDNLKQYFAKHPEKLYELPPIKFEELIADILNDFGFDIKITQSTRDGGKDILAYLINNVCSFLMFVECKKWSPEHHAGIEVVQRLYGVQQINNANKSMIVTTSFFTKPAIEECKRYKYLMELKDFNDIKTWLSKYNKPNPLLKPTAYSHSAIYMF